MPKKSLRCLVEINISSVRYAFMYTGVGAILSAVRYCSKSSRHRYRKIILAVRNPLATVFVGVVHSDRLSRGPSAETPSVRLSLSAQSRSGAGKLLAPTALGRRARGPFAKPPLGHKEGTGKLRAKFGPDLPKAGRA